MQRVRYVLTKGSHFSSRRAVLERVHDFEHVLGAIAGKRPDALITTVDPLITSMTL